jgi:16S rRNA G527 N7-methylase RsmG
MASIEITMIVLEVNMRRAVYLTTVSKQAALYNVTTF